MVEKQTSTQIDIKFGAQYVYNHFGNLLSIMKFDLIVFCQKIFDRYLCFMYFYTVQSQTLDRQKTD